MTNKGHGKRTTPAMPADEALLAKVAAKDRAAFEMLYRRYYRRLFHFVLKVVRVDQIAEETVDDVMFAVWTSAGAFAGRSSVSTWLFGIAYRQALKSVTRDRRHRSVAVEDQQLAQTPDPDRAVDPEAVAQDADVSALVQRGLDGLSEQHRTVVELTALGHSYAEISEVTGCCANTVKTRMFYARRQLKRFVAQQGTSFNPNDSGNDDKHTRSGA